MKALKAFFWLIAYVLLFFLIDFAVAFIGVIALSLPNIIKLIEGGIPEGELFSSVRAAVSASVSADELYRITAIASFISIVVFILILRARSKSDITSQSYTAKPRALNIWCAALLGLFFNFVVSYIYGAILSLPALRDAASDYSAASGSLYQGGVAVQVISVAILSPVLEELVFRGLIMGKLTSVVPGGVAIFIQAVIFASLHNGPVWMSYAFFCGILMGWLCYKTRSIFTSMAFHICFNAASFLPEIFPKWDAALFIALAVSLVEIFLAITIIALYNAKERKEQTEYVDI